MWQISVTQQLTRMSNYNLVGTIRRRCSEVTARYREGIIVDWHEQQNGRMAGWFGDLGRSACPLICSLHTIYYAEADEWSPRLPT
jgi:hypothetical protein